MDLRCVHLLRSTCCGAEKCLAVGGGSGPLSILGQAKKAQNALLVFTDDEDRQRSIQRRPYQENGGPAASKTGYKRPKSAH